MSEISNLPRHVAIIIDGNRRWARERGLQPWQGHIRGAKVLEDVSKAGIKLGIEYLTVWGGSYNNLTQRSPQEIKFLDVKMYRVWANRGLRDKFIHNNQVRVRFLGEWPKLLSKETCSAIRKLELSTKNYSKYNLTYLVGYNGDREMLNAIRLIEKAGIKRITDKLLKESLWTKDLPPVDLVIRTGDDAHNSTGFMMWDTRSSLLHFDKKMWPDFTGEDLKQIITSFSDRERRFGK